VEAAAGGVSAVAAAKVVRRPSLARCAACSRKGSPAALSRGVASCFGANAPSPTGRSTTATLVCAHRSGHSGRTGQSGAVASCPERRGVGKL
jgi:hypothetical protein